MAYFTDGLIGANLNATTTDAQFALGTRVTGTDGSQWLYVKAAAAINAYDFVGIDEEFNCSGVTKAITDAGWRIGVSQIAFAADEYGWVAIQGQNLAGKLLASCEADKSLFTCATTGALDDSSASQTEILGVVNIVAAVSTSAYEVSLTGPLVNLANV